MNVQIGFADALRRVYPATVFSYPQCRGWVCRETWCGRSSVTFDSHCLNKNVTEGKQFSQPIGNCAGSHVRGHAIVVGVVCRQSFRRSGPVAREARFVKAMRLAQLVSAGVAPIRYLPAPHTAHTALVAGRPFFIVTDSTLLESVFALHFTQ